MPKNNDLQKHTLHLYAGDYARVQQLYPDIGAAAVIRKILRDFLDRCEAAATAKAEAPEIEL